MTDDWSAYKDGDIIYYKGYPKAVGAGFYKLHKPSNTSKRLERLDITTGQRVASLSSNQMVRLATEEEKKTFSKPGGGNSQKASDNGAKDVEDIAALMKKVTLNIPLVDVEDCIDDDNDEYDEESEENEEDDITCSITDDEDDEYEGGYIRSWSENNLAHRTNETLQSLCQEFDLPFQEWDRNDMIVNLIEWRDADVNEDEPYPPSKFLNIPQNFDFSKYTSKPKVPLSKPFVYDFFLSHNWGDENRNHNNVITVKDFFDRMGFKCWCDQERFEWGPNLEKQMSDGIAQSKYFVIFVTKIYIDKVTKNDPHDNCAFEYRTKQSKHGKENVLFIVMEDGYYNPQSWGKLTSDYGKNLYVDLSPTRDEGDMDDKWKNMAEKLQTFRK